MSGDGFSNGPPPGARPDWTIDQGWETYSQAEHDVWITQREAEQASGMQRATTGASVSNPWNGRERRKRQGSANGTPSAAQLWEQLSERVSKPLITITLWVSIGLVGAMLLLFHQS